AVHGSTPAPEVVVLDLSACYEIDVTAADALAALVDDLRREGTEVRFAGAHRQLRDYAARLRLADLAGLENPHPTVDAALDPQNGT
ncbi:MAG: STAS domain-containing protein, partial [Candidatus Nanopelagicales bacterium]